MNDRVVKNPNFKNNGEFHKSLAARPAGTKDWPNTHTEVENLGGGKFAASIGVLAVSMSVLKSTVTLSPSWGRVRGDYG